MGNSKVPIVKLEVLETLRGISAIYVLIHHARWFLWMGYSNGYLRHLKEFDFINKILVYLFSIFIYGHEAVLLFFVLSGFVIHLKYAKKLSNGNLKFDFFSYLFKRIKRIHPAFLAALLITYVLDTLGRNLQYPIYGKSSPFYIINNNFNITSLLGNLAFLMNTYVKTWGSNFALWSLKYEWWFYMIYPCIYFSLKKSIYKTTAIIFILYCLSFFKQNWPNQLLMEISSYLIIWWLGVVLAEIYVKRIKVELTVLWPLILIIPIVIFSKIQLEPQLQDLFWALGFVGLLSILLHLNQQNRIPKLFLKLNFLGKFSYTLYIIHMPILIFISGYILKKDQTLPLTFNYMFFGIAICLFICWLLHFLLEVPFQKIGKSK